MNIKEGLRRSALILGIAGFAAGCFVADRNLVPLLQRRDRHREFHELASSPIVQRELARIKGGKKYRATKRDTGPRILFFWAGEKPPTHEETSRIVTDGYPVKAGLIHQIGLNEGELFFLRKRNGDTVYREIAPRASDYWLLAVFPLLGFLTPFGILNTVLWICAGFTLKNMGIPVDENRHSVGM